MLEKFLAKLGASTKITVGVSVSPNLGLEMVEIDRASGIVNKYSHRPLEYNSSTREIANYEQFRTALEELFEELNIPKRSNIVLSLPNVYFGMINLPLLLTDEAITNAIISEVEQSYIFKRQEPIISWTDVSLNTSADNRLLAYSAIQKTALEEIKTICEEIGCTLYCVESSYSSLFRALNYLDLTKEQMKENVSWNLMTIMQNNYSIISMSGKRTVEYYEEPLALKSFIDDEIYNAIKTSAQLTLAGLPANYLYIVSETDLVSAEVLSMKMPFEGSINFIECNKFVQGESIPVSLNVLPTKASQITLESIGSAIYTFSDYPLKFNFTRASSSEQPQMQEETNAPKINIGNLEVELTSAFIKKVAVIILSVTVLPIILLMLILGQLVIPKENSRLDKAKSQVENLNSEIQKYENATKGSSFDIKNETKKIVEKNKTKLTYYNALGISVPPKLWIIQYKTDAEGKVFIKGSSDDVKSIYAFYKSLKQTINQSDIKIRKLEVASDSIDELVSDTNSKKTYDFELTNMADTGASSPVATPGNDGKTAPQEQKEEPKEEAKPSLFQIGKPLFQNSEKTEEKPASDSNLPPNLKKIEKF